MTRARSVAPRETSELGSRAITRPPGTGNAPPDKPTRIFVNGEVEEFPVCDQYTIQGELFSRAIIENTEVPVPLEDALKNMTIIEEILRRV